MKSTFAAVVALGLLIAPAPASAACRWFGTQMDCDSSESRVVLGTQIAGDPAYARAVRPQAIRGGSGLGDDRTARPFRFDLQNIGGDPSLCRRIGNETYCY